MPEAALRDARRGDERSRAHRGAVSPAGRTEDAPSRLRMPRVSRMAPDLGVGERGRVSLRDYLFHEESGIQLYCGDARVILPMLAPVDLLLTDPPYPGFEKGWEVPDAAATLAIVRYRAACVFWPPLIPAPIEAVAESVWHKPEGRQSIGIEIEPKYCEIAVRRLRQEVLF